MEWQLLAIVVIVVLAVIWFVRDERRVKADARLNTAARGFASQSPTYRILPRNIPAPAPAKPRSTSLLRNDRAYFDQLLARRTQR